MQINCIKFLHKSPHRHVKCLAILLCIFLGLLACIKTEKVHAENSGMINFENNTHFNTSSLVGAFKSIYKFIDKCFLPYSFSDFSTPCIPYVLGPHSALPRAECVNPIQDLIKMTKISFMGIIGAILLVTSLIISIILILSGAAAIFGIILLIITLVTGILLNITACMNTYSLYPNEILSLQGTSKHKHNNAFNGLVPVPNQQLLDGINTGDNPTPFCILQNGSVTLNPAALQVMDVPYFYGCTSQCRISEFITAQMVKWGELSASQTTTSSCLSTDPTIDIGGYFDYSSQYCSDSLVKSYAQPALIRSITVCSTKFWKRIKGHRERCSIKDDECITLYEPRASASNATAYTGEVNGLKLIASYRLKSKRIEYCAIVIGHVLLPIVVGCTYVPPPYEEPAKSGFEGYLAGTRCQYALPIYGGRTDLHRLGAEIETADGNSTSVSMFLKSDLHVTSTVVGCVNDLLIKVFITPSSFQGESFFQGVQNNLRGIVLTVLVLYVFLIGFKMITSAHPPSRGELLMYLMKFALVLYFATGGAWYNNDPSLYKNGKGPGIYSALLDTTQLISDFFMQARESRVPISYCYHLTPGISPPVNLLSQQVYNHVHLTVWDYLDCSIATYMNFGSCKYSLEGLVGFWIITAAFWVGMEGLLLSLVTLIYIFILLLVIFKFVHITILCMFTITILVLMSPLIICFALFDATKEVFNAWAKMLIGYTLYPGLLFAFLALMLATFDSIFYGDLDMQIVNKYKNCVPSITEPGNCEITKVDFNKLCGQTHSIYCALLQTANTGIDKSSPDSKIDMTNCSLRSGQMVDILTETQNVPLLSAILGDFTVLKSPSVTAFYPVLIKMVLFAFLFYMFLQSVMSFMAALVGAQGISEGSMGSFNLVSLTPKIVSGGKNIAKKVGTGLQSIAGRLLGTGTSTIKRKGGTSSSSEKSSGEKANSGSTVPRK